MVCITLSGVFDVHYRDVCMKNDQILQKAVLKAIENGYTGLVDKHTEDIALFKDGNYIHVNNSVSGYRDIPLQRLIYDKDFAKALWGEGYANKLQEDQKLWTDSSCCSGSAAIYRGTEWQWHLQQMVIADDPIEYIYQAVFNEGQT